MSLATIGAFGLSFMTGEPEFAEAVFVMIFYQVGELFEHIAEGSSEKSITALLDLRPDIVHFVTEDGVIDTNPKDLKVGDIVEIYPGEKIAVDGVVIEGKSQIDTAALTGESLPRGVQIGDQVLSGTVNMTGKIQTKVIRVLEESTLAKILDLMEHSTENKSRNETFMAKFANIYTPIVVISAALLAVIPPLLSGDFISNFPDWFSRALTFLVISCPCALVISIPMSFFNMLTIFLQIGTVILLLVLANVWIIWAILLFILVLRFIRSFYITTSRDLKRMEGESIQNYL